jgi:cytidyltransferase-like protein
VSVATGPRLWTDKIVAAAELPALRARFRDRRIVQCHGAFDLVHIGHLMHFEEARALGDVLVVTITGDQYITKKRSVTFTEEHRARQVAALELVDYVAIIAEPTALSAIESLHPDVYVKGPEYANTLLDKSRSIFYEKQVLDCYGGRIHFTSGETFSSTKLAHFLLNAPDAAQADPLLRNEKILFRDIAHLKFTLEELKYFIAKAAALRVCVIGETIVDEWIDVSLTNLSTQSRCVAGQEVARVRQIGGVGIIARHLSHFVKHVHCYTNALPAGLAPNIEVTPLTGSELVETRFVDRDTGNPLFKSKSIALADIRHDQLPDFGDYDVVLIADYGHGLLDAAALNARIARSKPAFVAAMAQVNSSNYGYNLPTKYVGADYYCMNRTEAELCLHERGLALADLVDRATERLRCGALSVTDGSNGVMIRMNGERAALPTLSVSVVDTIGCGDAYFALSAIAARLGLPGRLVALTGSIAAAAMTQRRCNASEVTEHEFLTIGKIVI